LPQVSDDDLGTFTVLCQQTQNGPELGRQMASMQTDALCRTVDDPARPMDLQCVNGVDDCHALSASLSGEPSSFHARLQFGGHGLHSFVRVLVGRCL
jgi:hypothetical protein